MTREIQLKYKGNRCVSCGLSVDDMIEQYGTFNRMTEFHHIEPELKAENYNTLIQRIVSKEQLQELDKCVLLCRQCHGIVHAQDLSCKLKITVDFKGKEYSQTFNCSSIINKKDKTIRLLTADKNLLSSYLIKTGGNDPIPVIGVTLNDGVYLKSLIDELPKHKKVEIRDGTGEKKLLFLEHVADNEFDIQCSYSFPFIEIDFQTENKKSIWVTSGGLISSDGTFETEGYFSTRIALTKSPQ